MPSDTATSITSHVLAPKPCYSWYACRNECRDLAGFLRAAVHLDRRPDDLMDRRVAGELLRVSRARKPRLDPDPGVHGLADDARPPGLPQVHRYEVWRPTPGPCGGRASERIAIDLLRGRDPGRQTRRRSADRGDSRIAIGRIQRLLAVVGVSENRASTGTSWFVRSGTARACSRVRLGSCFGESGALACGSSALVLGLARVSGVDVD